MIGASASLATGLTFAAGILYIFFCIGNFTPHQVVPRHIKIVELTTFGLGQRILGGGDVNVNPAVVYGNPFQPVGERNPGDGLRLYYTWGLWNSCAGYRGSAHPQYCGDTQFAHEFRPTEILLEDMPIGIRFRGRDLFFGDRSGPELIKSDTYLSTGSRVAFYFIFVSLILVAIMVVFSLATVRRPGRLAYFSLSVISFLAFITALIGAGIWTGIIALLKTTVHGSQLGIRVRYGNALWILWAIVGVLFLSLFPYLSACIVGRPRKVETTANA